VVTAGDRRGFLVASGALIGTALADRAGAAYATEALVKYDYLFLQFSEGLDHVNSFVDYLASGEAQRLDSEGAQVVGLFAPWIGWSSNQAALLVRWRGDGGRRAGALASLGRAPEVKSVTSYRLTPIARGGADAQLPQGGMYIHRWFDVPSDKVDEFASLSLSGWPAYETRFDQRIFGLFRTEPTAEDRARKIARLLLITWYGAFAVWQATRGNEQDIQGIFARRARMTLNMTPAAALLIWPKG
jgi:hypothetical protein